MTNESARVEVPMNDALWSAVIGAIGGYLIARHCPEIAWLLHILTG